MLFRGSQYPSTYSILSGNSRADSNVHLLEATVTDRHQEGQYGSKVLTESWRISSVLAMVHVKKSSLPYLIPRIDETSIT